MTTRQDEDDAKIHVAGYWAELWSALSGRPLRALCGARLSAPTPPTVTATEPCPICRARSGMDRRADVWEAREALEELHAYAATVPDDSPETERYWELNARADAALRRLSAWQRFWLDATYIAPAPRKAHR